MVAPRTAWLARLLVAALALRSAAALVAPGPAGRTFGTRAAARHIRAQTTMGLFNSARQPARDSGVSVTLDPNIVLVDMCGTKVQAVEGQSLGAMAQRARAPIAFGCTKGECGSCESIVNGKKRRICTMAVPKKGPLVVKAQVKLGRNGKPVVKDW